MIEQLCIDQSECFPDLEGGGLIVDAGFQYSGWVVMGKDHIGGHAVKCQTYIAQKTTSLTCSDPCAKRFYKVKQKEKAIRRAEAETMVKREPKRI